MDDIVDDAPCPRNRYHSDNHWAPGSTQRPKLPVRDGSYPHPTRDQYADDEDDLDKDREEEEGEEEEEEEEEEEVEEEEEEGSTQKDGANQNGRDGGDDDSKNNDGNVGEDDDDDDDDMEKEGENEDEGKSYNMASDDERQPKKRKLKNLISSYEFAARAAAAPSSAVISSAPKSFGGRSPLTDWTEHETFVLLDAWGNKFLQLGRKSLRSEEWQDVAEKVSKESKIDRTDTQCRNRLDTLKKKYKKEKMRLAETRGATSKWVHFKKMEELVSSSSKQARLLRGSESREYMFSRPKVYLSHANGLKGVRNGLHEVRNSPGNSEASTDEENDSDGLPPKRLFRSGKNVDEVSSFRLLADSIQKFSEIYEKIERGKRKQMVELEKMRMDYTREMEMQKRKILERAHAAIAKIRRGDDEEIDVSAENVSG